MIDCPICKKPVDGPTCMFCGHSEIQASAKVKRHDPDWWRCVHEDRGQRCANPGVVSPAVHGGVFFCWQHVPAMQQMKDGVSCPPPDGFFSGWRKKLGPRQVDFEAELERKALQDEP